MNPIDWLRLGVEQYLRELTDDEFTELIQLVRPPDTKGSPQIDNASFITQVLGGGDD
ncbi:hypothetical protein KXD97_10035 [Mycobacterium sp. SMC-8]|uniref:hypothetical protein n=1 Tax=Mycobacterium sp. SMC-8 TaxID=2857060 RepID=UPI0021B167B2|nr:hypothetical protein [Mycobacterium sp. SMC-8]UXA14081.1 hypothetical protein KXD97_10035 [Mycobacterium sp. SMC-8]